MNPKNNQNHNNLILFMIIAMAILLGWNYIFPPPAPAPQQVNQIENSQNTVQTIEQAASLQNGQLISVKTDVFDAKIDMNSGDLRDLVLTRYNAADDENKQFVLLTNSETNTYVAQTGLLNKDGNYLSAPFVAEKTSYEMTSDVLTVRLDAQETNGVKVSKIYTFKKGSYIIGVDYEIQNQSASPIELSAIYRLLRDDKKPDGGTYFTSTYAGPVLYTPEGKFEKISFEDIAKGKAEYVSDSSTGWLGMIQHYFAAIWVLEPKDGESVCGKDNQNCQFDFVQRKKDNLYSAGVKVPLSAITPNQILNVPMTLYAGPQEYATITKVADQLQLVKDYGKVHLFASPLFWLLQKLHDVVHNWGWAIILLVLIVKIVLYPLNAAAYKSMAKMRAVAPKLQALKDEYGDDRMKMQQEMMALYKKENINPLGGCLPMLLQIPVFLGLYWALLSSVELRQAPWIGWITDLARTDPYFVLPLIMAATMFLQTFLNPPPTDPMQARMMKIMPIIFSVMFFFFPAGLVLYWVVNNILSIIQQWIINRQIEDKVKHHQI
ncbi:MAG: membrane protein insertase YidC [Neisseriaceae bacterium]|nr:membrane protein insertase YidC [Neisseriaceae bacterium]